MLVYSVFWCLRILRRVVPLRPIKHDLILGLFWSFLTFWRVLAVIGVIVGPFLAHSGIPNTTLSGGMPTYSRGNPQTVIGFGPLIVFPGRGFVPAKRSPREESLLGRQEPRFPPFCSFWLFYGLLVARVGIGAESREG